MVWTSWPCDNDGEERWCWTHYQYCWEWVNGSKVLKETAVGGNHMGGADCPPYLIIDGEEFPLLRCNSRCQ